MERRSSSSRVVERAMERPEGETPADAVERVANVLLAFVETGPDQGVSEIARRVRLPKSTVHRILDRLVRTNLVARDRDRGRYRLGPRAVQLGMAALGTPDIRAIGAPVMADLQARTAETVTLTLLTGSERVYVAQVVSPQPVRMTVEIGPRFPLYAGASGRAILAYFPASEMDRYLKSTKLARLTANTVTNPSELRRVLAEVRRRGYASSTGERDPAAASVAVPIRNALGQVVGALSLCGPVPRFPRAQVAEYARMLAAAVRVIESGLEGPMAATASVAS